MPAGEWDVIVVGAGHAVLVMPFRDGRSLTMSCDRDATRAEIARFWQPDGEAYDRLLNDWDD